MCSDQTLQMVVFDSMTMEDLCSGISWASNNAIPVVRGAHLSCFQLVN